MGLSADADAKIVQVRAVQFLRKPNKIISALVRMR
jgi:hypothetical protein